MEEIHPNNLSDVIASILDGVYHDVLDRDITAHFYDGCLVVRLTDTSGKNFQEFVYSPVNE